MPETITPPPDAFTNPNALVYWVLAGMTAMLVALWLSNRSVTKEYQEVLKEQKADARETATAIAEFKSVLSQVLEAVKSVLEEQRRSK